MNFGVLRVEGGYFGSEKTFKLFKNKNKVSDKYSNATIIYGKNGSGKSSISRAIAEKIQNVIDLNYDENKNEFNSINFFKYNEENIEVLEEINDELLRSMHFYVYNEEFIKRNIKFKSAGLETIVMLGEQKDIEQEIEEINKLIKEKLEEHKSIKLLLEKLLNEANPESPQAIHNAIRSKLQERWAIVQGTINKLTIRAKVNNNLFNRLLNYQSIDIEYSVKSQILQEKINELLQIREHSRIPDLKMSHINTLNEKQLNLLSQKLDKPNLTENEQKILLLIQKSSDHYLHHTREIMNNDTINDCPLCFQTISSKHKINVLNVIQKLLQTDDANEHIELLNSIKFIDFHLDLTPYKKIIDPIVINELEQSIRLYNEELSRIRTLFKSKINSPYTPIVHNSTLETKINKIKKNIERLTEEISKFNDKFKNENALKKELTELNLELAYVEVKELLAFYRTKKSEQSNLQYNLNDIVEEGKKLRFKLSSLKAKLANVHIACDAINNYLTYIFFDPNRLQLEAIEDTYLVKCRGNSVELKSLSLGERNAISLCYFFAQLFKEKNIQNVFADELTLVIDDPISSFDYENKIGVYSFIRFLLNELHSTNSRSKSLILTHDLESFQNFQKIYSDIDLKNISLLELKNKELTPIAYKNFNEYSTLLQNIYDYANKDEDFQYDSNIGNSLRRVLEAFSTFNYKLGIESLSTNPNVLNLIADLKLRDYYKNSMYRLVLHSESHFEERTKGLIDRNFVESISPEEKIQTAKAMLVLLYTLNPLHVELHLKKIGENQENTSKKIQQICLWKNELTLAPVT